MCRLSETVPLLFSILYVGRIVSAESLFFCRHLLYAGTAVLSQHISCVGNILSRLDFCLGLDKPSFSFIRLDLHLASAANTCYLLTIFLSWQGETRHACTSARHHRSFLPLLFSSFFSILFLPSRMPSLSSILIPGCLFYPAD